MLTFLEPRGGGKSLLLIPVVLLTHLKAGFVKKGWLAADRVLPDRA